MGIMDPAIKAMLQSGAIKRVDPNASKEQPQTIVSTVGDGTVAKKKKKKRKGYAGTLLAGDEAPNYTSKKTLLG